MDFENLKIPRCKNFSGYKPCISYEDCLQNGCRLESSQTRIGKKILIISLDAMGNVLYNTPVLRAIKRKFKESTIYWITMPNAEKILHNNNFIDRVFVWTDEHRMILRNLDFDIVYNGDKSDYACAFAAEINAKEKFGFLLNKDGKIIPANEGAMYSYQLGLNDQMKFRTNERSGIDILHEAFELEYKRDEYVFSFTFEEKDFIEKFKENHNYDPNKFYVGFNTGCSNLFPNKKMTVDQHIYLITELLKFDNIKIVLLGGKEDTERNLKIYDSFTKEEQQKILYTPTNLGLRQGAAFVSLCDLVVTGDSFGMHLSIAQKKTVIVWFGVSCPPEIELYGRGEKLVPQGLECHPCWKKSCPYNLECIDMIPLDRIIELVKKYSLLKTSQNINN